MTNSEDDSIGHLDPTPPTPKDVAEQAPNNPAWARDLNQKARSRLAAVPDAESDDEDGPLPPHLVVCDELEDVLDLIGASPVGSRAPEVVVRCAHLPREKQRNTIKRLLTWPGVQASAPDNGNRVYVSFDGRPQLRVEFAATAVAAQHFEPSQVSRWHVDNQLMPGYGQGPTHPVLP